MANPDDEMRVGTHNGHLMAAALKRHHDKPVIHLGDVTLTGAEVSARISQYVQAFEDLGAGRGTAGALLALNRPEVLFILGAGIEGLEGLDVLADPLRHLAPGQGGLAEMDHRLVLVPLERGDEEVSVVGADPHRVVEVRGTGCLDARGHAPRLERVPVLGNHAFLRARNVES